MVRNMNEELEKILKDFEGSICEDCKNDEPHMFEECRAESIRKAFQAGYDKGRHEAVEQFNKHIEVARNDGKSSTIVDIIKLVEESHYHLDKDTPTGNSDWVIRRDYLLKKLEEYANKSNG